MQIGLVIPIIQTKYIFALLKQIKQTICENQVIICVVNDGNIKIYENTEENLENKKIMEMNFGKTNQ